MRKPKARLPGTVAMNQRRNDGPGAGGRVQNLCDQRKVQRDRSTLDCLFIRVAREIELFRIKFSFSSLPDKCLLDLTSGVD